MKKLLLLIGLASVTAAAVAQSGTRTAPTSFNTYSKGIVLGTIQSVLNVDKNYLVVVPVRNQPVTVEFTTTLVNQPKLGTGSAADYAPAQVLNFHLDTIVNSGGAPVFVDIEMFDWYSGTWTSVYQDKMFGEASITASTKSTRFVNPKSFVTKARVTWSSARPIKMIGIDAAQWSYSN